MATDLTIDAYLAALRRRLRGRDERDELLAEVEDHLRTSVEARAAGAAPTPELEREVVAAFGEPELVAGALLEVRRPALATRRTRDAGVAGLVAAGAWVAFAVLWVGAAVADDGRNWEGLPQALFMAGTMALFAAGVLTLFVFLGLDERHGGLGTSRFVALVPAVVAIGAMLISWFVAGWATVVSVAWVAMAALLWRRCAVPRAALLLSALAWPIGLATWAGLAAADFGEVDEWGDHADAMIIGVVVGAGLLAAGLVGIGRSLSAEEPVGDQLDPAARAL